MPTFIHGIAASENIDSSGERIIIAGLDSSSLEKDGVFNWEHKADQPGQVVGKVLKARKIFSEADCEDEHQLHFFKKCGVPYLYVMGELMDDYKESAREVAGQFQYDADRKQQNATSTANFSIEGAKIDKQGMDIVKSIARKVTITVLACNKAAVAEMLPAKKPKDNIDSLFKTEAVEAEILKYEPLQKDFSDAGPSSPSLMGSELKKKIVKPALAAKPNPLGTKIHQIGDRPVLSGQRPMDWHGSDVSTFRGIRDAHFNASNATTDNKLKMFHLDQSKRFEQAAGRLESRQTASANALKPKLGLGVSQPAKAPSPATPPTTASVPRMPTSSPKPPSIGGIKSDKLFDPHLSGRIKPPGPGIQKSEEDFSHLSTDEDANELMNRIEDKYFVTRSALDYLTQTIKENLKNGDIDTEVRYNTNRSIYLDNKDLDSLKDALNSVKPRIKIRIRQYSPNGSEWEQVAYVEIKAKDKGVSNKIRVRIHAGGIEEFLAGHPIQMSEGLAIINKDITKAVLEKRVSLINNLVSMYGFKKQIEVRYERRAYTSDDVRITIDDNFRFMGAEHISDDNILAIKCTEGWVNILQLDHKLANEGYLILEVKHTGETPKWVEKCLEKSNAKKVKFSKYCGAMTCVVETKQSEGHISSAVVFRDQGEMAKAMEAGGMGGIPSTLTQGAALAKEDLKVHMAPVMKPQGVKPSKPGAKHGTVINKLPPIKKSKWLARAEDEYNKWEKKEQFEQFMSKRLPHMTKGEVRAIGQVMALNKAMTLEKALEKISGHSLLAKKHQEK